MDSKVVADRKPSKAKKASQKSKAAPVHAEAAPVLSRMEIERAHVLSAARFHDRYLRVNFVVGNLETPFDAYRNLVGRLVPFLECETVLLPGEVLPSFQDNNFISESGLIVVTSRHYVLEASQATVIGVLARIVATGSSLFEGHRVLLIKGCRRVKVRPTTIGQAEVVEDLPDYDLPIPSIGHVAKKIVDRLKAEERKEGSFEVAAESPLSETMRSRILLDQDPLSRCLTLLRLRKRTSYPLFCKTCFIQDGRLTKLVADGRQLSSRANCVNPAGNVFHLLNYEDDQNREGFMIKVGPVEMEHTWFEHFGWSYAICRRCGNLLGWRYTCSNRSINKPPFWGIHCNAVMNLEELNLPPDVLARVLNER